MSSHSLLQEVWPKDLTQVSCIAGRFFTFSAAREAQGRRDQEVSHSP